MNELYEMIEKKIQSSGCPYSLSGRDIYDDICDQIDGKENGAYVVLSKFEDDIVMEYQVTIMDEEFNLGLVTIRTPKGVFQVDFDK